MKRYQIILLVFMLLLFASCNRYKQENYIRKLEKKFWESRVNEEKETLSEKLHRAYSIYHLKHPEDTVFLRNWAKLAKAGKLLEQEKYCYTKYLEKHASPGIYRKRGAVNVKLAYYGEAAKDFFQAARLSRGKKREQDLKNGRYYERVQERLAHLDSLLEKGGPEAVYRLQRAEIFLENGKPDYAKYEADYLLQEDSSLAGCYYILARVAQKTRQYEKARVHVDKYLALESKWEKQKIKQAKNLKKNVEARILAKELKRKYLQHPKNASLLAEIGKQYFFLSEYSEAKKFFTKYIAARPDSARGYVYRGQCYIQIGKLEDALHDLNMAVKIEPSNISALNLKGYVYLLQQDTLEAKKEIEAIRSYNGNIIKVLEGI